MEIRTRHFCLALALALGVHVWALSRISLSPPEKEELKPEKIVYLELAALGAPEPEPEPEPPKPKPEPPKPLPEPQPPKPQPLLQPPPPPPPQQKGIPSGVRQGISQETLSRYLTTVFKMIDKKKKYPSRALRRREEGKITLRLTLARDGSLIDVVAQTEKPKALAEASIKAVRAAAPFPAFPKGLDKDKASFEIPVIYRLQ